MSLLFVQIAVILLVTVACGWLARRVGQARVVGEIMAGIILGPSLFGRLAPHLSVKLFPAGSLTQIDFLSNVGLVLFLFLIGMELEYHHVIEHRATTALASTMSMLFPFVIAALLAHSLRIRFAPLSTGQVPFVIFLAISMGVTAFPVLARILEERNMHATALGTTSLMCAAVDDVVAWILLAVGLALIGRGDSASLTIRLAGVVGFLVFMIGVLRPAAAWAMRRFSRKELSIEMLGVVIACVLLSAAATAALGVHPLFGAFIAGLVFPRLPGLGASIRSRVDMLVSVLLLPLFFVLTGMRTQLGLLAGGRVWLWMAIILIAAVAGKVGGAAIAARWMGQSWRSAVALGVLLNTRGLVELVILNIAFEAGMFSSTLFTMLVVMALITTVLTTPLLNLMRIGERTTTLAWGYEQPASTV